MAQRASIISVLLLEGHGTAARVACIPCMFCGIGAWRAVDLLGCTAPHSLKGSGSLRRWQHANHRVLPRCPWPAHRLSTARSLVTSLKMAALAGPNGGNHGSLDPGTSMTIGGHLVSYRWLSGRRTEFCLPASECRRSPAEPPIAIASPAKLPYC